jgi:hypothetical protein
LSSRYENGIDDSRLPIVTVPLSLIFFSVPVSSCAWTVNANAALIANRPIFGINFIGNLQWGRRETAVGRGKWFGGASSQGLAALGG